MSEVGTDAVAELWHLYDSGKMTETVVGLDLALQVETETAKLEALNAIYAWCHYRKNEYPASFERIKLANGHPRALECEMYILSYAKGYEDDVRLVAISKILGPDNMNCANALVIRAKNPNSQISPSEVFAVANYFSIIKPPLHQKVATANLFHNVARYFLAKPGDANGLKLALGFIDVAVAHYGEVENWHHRAAANFWKSQILEVMGLIPDAFKAAFTSMMFWTAQCGLEKDTSPFKERLENAVKRMNELTLKLQAYALAHGLAS